MATGPSDDSLAHAEFEFSIDDLVDVSMRHLRTIDSHQRLRRRGSISTAAMGGMAMFVLLSLFANQPPLLTGVLSAVTALVAGSLHHLRLDGMIARRLRRHLAGMHGAGPHPCRVELHADRVIVRQLANPIEMPWSQVIEVQTIGNDIELRSRTKWTVVRSRAFATPAEREAFLATAQRLWRAAQQASASIAVS